MPSPAVFLLAFHCSSDEEAKRIDADLSGAFGSCIWPLFPGLWLVQYGLECSAVVSKLARELPNLRNPCLVSAIPERAWLRASPRHEDGLEAVLRLAPQIQVDLA